MASTLFKPVYVASLKSVQRKLDTQQNNVVDSTENQLPPSPITNKYFSENLKIDFKTPQSPSIQLSTSDIPKYVSKKVINLHSSREYRDASDDDDDDDSKNVYVARPYRHLMALSCDSTCTNSRPCSSAMDDSQAIDCLSTPKTLHTMYQENYPSESLPTFSSCARVPPFSDMMEKTEQLSSGNEQRNYVHCAFKSTNDCYLTVPDFDGKMQNLVSTSAKVDGFEPAKECLSPCGLCLIQSKTSAQPSSLRSLTPTANHPISLVSRTQSPDYSQGTKSLPTSYCHHLSSRTGGKCGYDSNTMSDAAIVSTAENAVILNRVRVTQEVKPYVAKRSIYKEYVSPCVFNNVVFHLTSNGLNSWLPCSSSLEVAKRMICSKMYTACSVVGRFPVQFIEHRQIPCLHAEFAIAKGSLHGDTNTNPTLVFKSVMFQESYLCPVKQTKEYEPIFPTQTALESCDVWPKAQDMVTEDPHYSIVPRIYQHITNGKIGGQTCSSAAVHSCARWRSRAFSQGPNQSNKCSTLREKKKYISESSSLRQGASLSSCSVSSTYSSVSTVSCSSNNSATATKGRSISSGTVESSLKHTHTDNESSSLIIKRKNAFDVHHPNQIQPEAKETQLQQKGGLKLNVKKEPNDSVMMVRSECQFNKSDTPLLEFKIVPRIPDVDDEDRKRAKLNVIKGTTSFHQLFDRIASRKPTEDSRIQNVESAPISTISLSRLEYIQTKTYDCVEDNISVDSSTLIPEGHPSIGKSGRENEEIYLSCTYILQKPRNKPMKQLFELESSSSEKATGEISFEVPERDKSSERLKSSVSDIESESKSNLQPKGLCALNKTALARRSLSLKKRRNSASRLMLKNTVTWASDVTRASDIEKDETKPSRDSSVTQDVKTESEMRTEKKPERDVSARETQITKDPCLTDDIANDTTRDCFQWNDQSTVKEVEDTKGFVNSTLEQTTSKLKNEETQPRSGDTVQRLTFLTSELKSSMEKTEKSQGSAMKMTKEAELQELKRKYETLRRELKTTSSATGKGHEAPDLSSSTTTPTLNTYKRVDLRRFPKHSGRISRQLAKSKRHSHRNRHESRYSSSDSRKGRHRNRNHEWYHQNWLPMPPYAMYPPPPALHAYPGYPYPPLPYYHPLPQLLPQPQIMPPNYFSPPPPPPPPPPIMLPVMADQWNHRHFRSSRKHKHPKSRDSRHHRHQAKRKSSHKRRKAKRAKRDAVCAASCPEVTVHSLANKSLSSGFTRSIQSQPLPTNLLSGISSFKSQQISPLPPSVLQQPPVEPISSPTSQMQLTAPSGTYNLPDTVGPSFNPFKGHSLPNEPSGLVETRLMTQSPPTKSIPSPSAAFSGALGVGRIPSAGIPAPLTAAQQQLPPTNSPVKMAPPPLPKSESVPLSPPMTIPNTAQPPNRRASAQNGPPRQPLSAIMGPPPQATAGAAVGAPRAPQPTAGAKVDGPQVTSTGEKYGLFRLPTSQAEYQSCEKRFDWLQSEKNHLENTLNKLSADCGLPGPAGRKMPLGTKESQEEARITGALNQISREMSALRLVMKKYTNEKKKGLLLKTTTF